MEASKRLRERQYVKIVWLKFYITDDRNQSLTVGNLEIQSTMYFKTQ